MSEPAPEEVQAEENPADEPAEEAVPAEETAEATGAPVVKTDEELLAGVYKQLENFYGVVDAETVWEMLTTPTKSAFTRTMGAGAIAGRLMGGRAAKTAAANLLKGKVKSLGEGWTTKDPVPVKAFVKLLLPLPLRKSAYSDLIIYDFEQQGDCESFLAAYLVEQDGFLFASETNGCNQMKLLKSVRTPTRLALYEEWDDQESFMKSGTGRAEPSFLMQHLGADMGSGKFARLKGESAAVQGYALLAEDVREVMAPRTSSCAIITICEFKEKEECDAWLAHYLADLDGLALATSFAGCNCLKLRRGVDAPTKVLFYEEWDDQWGSQKLTGERFDSGYLTRWFGAEGSAMGKWLKLVGERPDVQQYALQREYDTHGLASTVPVMAPDPKLAGNPQPHYSLPRYK